MLSSRRPVEAVVVVVVVVPACTVLAEKYTHEKLIFISWLLFAHNFFRMQVKFFLPFPASCPPSQAFC